MRKLIALFLALTLVTGVSAALADQTVTVSGTGEVYVTADTAVVSLGVNTRSKDALQAQSAANEAVAKIREALTAAGFAEEDISTGYINLYAAYDYSGFSGEEEKISGYNASSNLSIKVTDMERVGEVIDLAFGAGANSLDGVSFSVADDAAARAEALKLAVANAKDKAAVLAEAAGIGEMKIKSIQESSVYAFDSGMNNFSVAAKGYGTEADFSSTVIQAAKICVSATVSVVFEADD